jgi:SPP1 family predicted phage head-tail adaptor
MRAGRLNSAIIIESKTEVINTVGEPIETWSTFTSIRAEVRTQSGKEFISAKAQHSELSHVITCRYISGVNSKMRINNGGEYYNILSVFDPSSRKREMRIYCSEQL